MSGEVIAETDEVIGVDVGEEVQLSRGCGAQRGVRLVRVGQQPRGSGWRWWWGEAVYSDLRELENVAIVWSRHDERSMEGGEGAK